MSGWGAAELCDSSARIVTPLFCRALGNGMYYRDASLKKFYEISAKKELLCEGSDYTKRGREMRKVGHDCAGIFRGFGKKPPGVPLRDTVRQHVLVDKASVR